MNHDEAKILPAAHLADARRTCCEPAALWASDAASVPLPAVPGCMAAPDAPPGARAAAAPVPVIPSVAPPSTPAAQPPSTSAAQPPSTSAAAQPSCACAVPASAAPCARAAVPSCAPVRSARAGTLAPDEHIAAILPIYDEHGRGVAVYTSDGGCCVYGLRLRTILAHLAERNCRTLPLIRRRMHLLLGGRQEHPLPISPQLVLVPCKVLTPRVRGDETIGYFSLAQVVRLIAPPAAHGNPPARRHVKQARGKGRPVCHAAPSAQTRAVRHGAPSAQTRAARHAAPSTSSRLALHAAPSAPPRPADACPAYELADGRRIPLLATLATARIRLALAAYAKDHMFPQTCARER